MRGFGAAGDLGDGEPGGHDDDGRERHVDVEAPAPAGVVGEQAAEQRADHGRDAEDGAERALELAALAQRDDVGDQGGRGDRQAAGAETLERARRDQPGHALGEAAEHRADDEDGDAELEDVLATELVTDLADHHGDRGLGEQVGRHHPRDVVAAAEVADDRRQRRRHDGAVERGQQHAEADGRERQDPGPPLEGDRRRRRGAAGAGDVAVADIEPPGRSDRQSSPRQAVGNGTRPPPDPASRRTGTG